MSNINYHNRQFRSRANTGNGEVSGETTFHYHQEGMVIWADYAGGEVLKGHLIGTTDDQGNLNFVYHHLNQQKELKTGKCQSTPEVLDNGKVRLKEHWQWTSGDYSSGESIIEEI